MMWYLAEVTSLCIDVLLYIYFYHRCLIKRPNVSVFRVLVLSVGYLIVKILYYAAAWSFGQYASIIFSAIFCFIIFEDSFRMQFIWVVISIALNGIINFLVMNLSVLFPGIDYSTTLAEGVPRILCMLATKVLMFLCFYLLTRRIYKGAKLSPVNTLLLISVPVGCWILLELLFIYSNVLIEPIAALYLPMLSGSSMLLILLACVMLYNKLTLQEREYASIAVQLHLTSITHSHIEQLNSLYARLERVQHSLNNRFTVIKRLMEDRNYQKVNEYLDDVEFGDLEAPIYVGYPVLDALVGSKQKLAKDAGIDYDVNVVLPDPLPISDVQICILFGNLLDNAFDALGQLHNSERRFISLAARPVDEYWVVVCQNATDNKKLRSMRHLPSTKTEEGLHGIGTRQITEIAQDSGGFVTFEQKDLVFTATVMLKFQSQSILDTQEVS